MRYPRTEIALGVFSSAIVSATIQAHSGMHWPWIVIVQVLNAIANAISIRWCVEFGTLLASFLPQRQKNILAVQKGSELVAVVIFQFPIYLIILLTETQRYASFYFLIGCVGIWLYREAGVPLLDRWFQSKTKMES